MILDFGRPSSYCEELIIYAMLTPQVYTTFAADKI